MCMLCRSVTVSSRHCREHGTPVVIHLEGCYTGLEAEYKLER